MKNKSARITIFAVCVLLGFLLMLQVKSVKIHKQEDSIPTRTEQLTELLIDEQERNAQLTLQLDQYKAENERFKKEMQESGGEATVLLEKLARAEILSGHRAVQGRGITVTLSDSTAKNNAIDENAFVVHDTDLLRVINELRAAGAEAISLNGERILATSEIRCAGPVVSINNRRYNIPFVIAAIGDPDVMETALKMRGGIIDELNTFEIYTEIVKHENIVIDALRHDVIFSYAKPVEEE
ncbi:MAG: DUF881 domain-containing protein [Clostridia bacterium]|nr:DUF881 domain-containing protein [Clostridia bacterium]